jgi:hypothetical protein
MRYFSIIFSTICVFLFGTANIYSAIFSGGNGSHNNPYQISRLADMEELADSVNNGVTTFRDEFFILTRNIDDTVTKMIGNDVYYFRGTFFGNHKKIVVNIVSNNNYVGLFSQLGAGNIGGYLPGIVNLALEGTISGGTNSRFVGGFIGKVLSDYFLENCVNLSAVNGLGDNSSVGGIAGGAVSSSFIVGNFNNCVNNGVITGKYAIGGIIGSVSAISSHIHIIVCKNAGTIQTNSNNPTYMGGIIGLFDGMHSVIHHAVNIGKILSRNSKYSGGIAGYLNSSNGGAHVVTSLNAGLVDGGTNSVGGICGYISNGTIDNCINTNWVERGSGTASGSSGAIVGHNNVLFAAINVCYFDNQMCTLDAIGMGTGTAMGLPTAQMLGNNLGWQFSSWNTHPQLYPNPDYSNHLISLLAAAPIQLRNNERLNNVTTSPFKVSNNYWYPNQIPYPYRFRWNSINGFVNIPTTFDDAFIVGTGGILRQDTLRVILLNEPLYEKLVPIWIR